MKKIDLWDFAFPLVILAFIAVPWFFVAIAKSAAVAACWFGERTVICETYKDSQ